MNRYVLRPICNTLGIPHGGMHAFRQGRASNMQDEGVNEKIIQLEVGHGSMRLTQRYTHFSPENGGKPGSLIVPIVPNFAFVSQ